jgi:hypothetical protein
LALAALVLLALVAVALLALASLALAVESGNHAAEPTSFYAEPPFPSDVSSAGLPCPSDVCFPCLSFVDLFLPAQQPLLD